MQGQFPGKGQCKVSFQGRGNARSVSREGAMQGQFPGKGQCKVSFQGRGNARSVSREGAMQGQFPRGVSMRGPPSLFPRGTARPVSKGRVGHP